ncbi:MAG: LemA family protein [Chloroflexota bacterium]
MEFLITIGVIAAIALYIVGVYNGLIGRRNRVRNAWAQIDVQLKRRHDLIPNLVEAVKGYMAHEQGVMEQVTDARARAISAGANVTERAEAENALTSALRTLFSVSEAYPDLKANQNMLALQEELASTENRVGFSRQAYNDSVMEYNTARETLPASLFAGALGFSAEALFTITDDAERAVPKVQF